MYKAYRTETTNKYKLEERVIRDNEGEVLTHRQRDEHHKQKGYTIEYALLYKKVSKDKSRKGYIGKWRRDAHSHPIHSSLFEFPIHLSALEEY